MIFTNSFGSKPVFRAKATASPRLSIMENRRKLLATFTRFACAAVGPTTKVFLASVSNNGEQRSIPSFGPAATMSSFRERSEEHTSELQSQSNLVCRLLLEK